MATSIKSNAENTARSAGTVSSAADEASTNVDTVAAAAEQLFSFGSEIANIVSESAEVAREAVAEVGRANEGVAALDSSAQKIGEVKGLRLTETLTKPVSPATLRHAVAGSRAGSGVEIFGQRSADDLGHARHVRIVLVRDADHDLGAPALEGCGLRIAEGEMHELHR